MANHDLYLKNARIPDRGPVNLLVADGMIAEISGEDLTAPDGAAVVDAGGDLLCPGLVDGHLHLDKTLIGLPWMPHSAGPTRQDRIQNDKSVMPTLPLSVEVRAANLVRQAISKGTTHMRSHVDVTNEVGLKSLHDVMKVRDQFAGTMDIQIVAFPQDGVVSSPGTIDLLEAAIGEGAELIGGIDPAVIDRDPVGQLDALFAAAERTGAGMDIHLHEPGELGNFNIVLICERAKAHGMTGKVTISHGFALGAINDATFEQTAAQMAEAGVSVVTFGPGSSPMLPLKKLDAAGVTVFAGSDAIRDTWWPFGNGDMVERAQYIAYRVDYRRDDDIESALDYATYAAAEVLGVENYGLEAGCRADFVTLPAETLAEAIVDPKPRSLVVKNGRVLAQNGELEDGIG
jgi:cytosine deaminase